MCRIVGKSIFFGIKLSQSGYAVQCAPDFYAPALKVGRYVPYQISEMHLYGAVSISEVFDKVGFANIIKFSKFLDLVRILSRTVTYITLLLNSSRFGQI